MLVPYQTVKKAKEKKGKYSTIYKTIKAQWKWINQNTSTYLTDHESDVWPFSFFTCVLSPFLGGHQFPFTSTRFMTHGLKCLQCASLLTKLIFFLLSLVQAWYSRWLNTGQCHDCANWSSYYKLMDAMNVQKGNWIDKVLKFRLENDTVGPGLK